jgi:biopolymer transport protein ExbD
MATKRRFLDVWIVESDTVYREVPYNVVVGWVSQGRLVEDDMLRWSGQAEWFRLGGTPAFAAYMPRSEPTRADDQAEALEPVSVAFAWKGRPPDDDEDVDMIPLIDVSLVLLIFFMMVASTGGALAYFNPPTAAHAEQGTRDLWVGIKSDANGNPIEYYLGKGDNKVLAKTPDWDTFVGDLNEQLQANPDLMQVTLMSDESLKFESVLRMLVELEKHPKLKVVRKYIGVTEKH